ncbi:conserved protein of unknown function [Tenacibaculum sp. 190130A14a]|uniref:Uncharacterized protein n=1 Tax=Tenacibaculum polynesiense TaxID=3137857 RepID=A0ABP1EY66_9FLAO
MKKEIQDDFISYITVNANHLVNNFNQALNNSLDYSVESLLVLDDEILNHLHNNQQVMNEQELTNIIHRIGCYIFEVARRNFGGKYDWHWSLNQPALITGYPSFEITILTFTKVKHRIIYGSKESIPSFFNIYMKKVKTAKKGEKFILK